MKHTMANCLFLGCVLAWTADPSLAGTAASASGEVLYVSSQGPQGWIKDAQTAEDFRYAATNDFDYVTFEVGARKVPEGWFEASLAEIAGSGKKPWLVLKKRMVSGKSAPREFETLAKAGFKDADIVVEADDVGLLCRYAKGHPDVRRVLAVDFRIQQHDLRLVRVPAPSGVAVAWEPWTTVLKECREAKAWGVRVPSKRFCVRKETIDLLHGAGLKVILHNVNDPVTGGYYRRAGADAFVTAQPSCTRGAREAWPTGQPKKTLLFGHRGGEDNLAPEHSPALTRLAVEHKMDIIKLDLQLTKDGAIVTSHDPSAKRVFGVDRKISDMTLAELKEMVALPVAGYTNEHIQTLEEVLAIAKDGIPQFGLDFKAFTPEMAEKALAIIAKAGVAEDRIFIITYTLKALAYMKERHPTVRRVMHTSASYDPRTGRYCVYQDVPGHVGAVVKKGTPVPTYATCREACQRILDFYKKEYGLYGINIGVWTGNSDGPYGRFRLSPEDIAFLQAGGLWVSLYMPMDPVICDYYRRAGADAFITASAAGTYEANDKMRMVSVAHRGLRGEEYIPNTVEAVKAAYAAGAKWVEVDFNLLKNGRILCLHGRPDLRRMAGVDHDIVTLTEEEIASIDIGKSAKRAEPVRMPYIEDILACVPKDCFIQCEIKAGYTKEFPGKFDAAVKAAGLSERNILVSAGDLEGRLVDFHRQKPKYRLLWLMAGMKKDTLEWDVDAAIARAKAAGVDIMCPGCGMAIARKATPAIADKIRAAGLDFRLFGVNTPEQLAYAVSMGATAFTTDNWFKSFEWAKEIPNLELQKDIELP